MRINIRIFYFHFWGNVQISNIIYFTGNQMRGGNQGGPSPWQQGSVPQQQQQQFHPQQQQQQQRQYPQQNPQMMQQRPQQQQQLNWDGNPAWGNQRGQGK